MAGGDNMLNENFTSLEKYFRDGNLNNVLRFLQAKLILMKGCKVARCDGAKICSVYA